MNNQLNPHHMFNHCNPKVSHKKSSINPIGLSWYQDTRATSRRRKLSNAKAHCQSLRPTIREQQEQSCSMAEVKQRVSSTQIQSSRPRAQPCSTEQAGRAGLQAQHPASSGKVCRSTQRAAGTGGGDRCAEAFPVLSLRL